jgi:endonuclease VIII
VGAVQRSSPGSISKGSIPRILADVPEADTIHYAANRMRPILVGSVPDEIRTPHPRHAIDRWPERLDGRAVTSVDAHGKHLFVRFDGDLTLHSHLRMGGWWGVFRRGERWRRSPRRAWLVVQARGHEVVQFDGPVLELLTESRTRFDRRLAALGPDILAPELDEASFLRRLREDDPTRAIGDALLDQRTLAGIGNLWKVEGCWRAELDPWRAVRDVSDAEALELVRRARPLMLSASRDGNQSRHRRIYGRVGRPCPRCGNRIRSRGQGDDNRITYWCPGCQR